MTSIELYKEEVAKMAKEKGMTNWRQMADSTTAMICLSVLAENGELVDQLKEEQKNNRTIFELRAEIMRLRIDICRLNEQRNKLWKDASTFSEELERKKLEARYKYGEYIEKFNESLTNCETAEGRDKARAAQLFINTVNNDTKYDNTAFIIALGSILAGGTSTPIEQLRKINPKLFKRQERKEEDWF